MQEQVRTQPTYISLDTSLHNRVARSSVAGTEVDASQADNIVQFLKSQGFTDQLRNFRMAP